ncbi:MAG: glutamyl-tRNA reductase [Actinomycetia bacterium]|nr:glutamyl-tRNA reductase [Actinomycetes bacterium]
MSLIVVGLNHHTVPVELLERVSVPSGKLAKALHDLSSREHLAEVVVLSTCNRTEVYARCTLFHPAVQDVRDFLAEHSATDPTEFDDHLYTYYDDSAVAHLFGVAAGVDSMIVGEGEILGQVREAWRLAEAEHATGPLLSRVFRHAVEVGKRARSETEIGRHAVSISSAAVAMAEQRVSSLRRSSVLVLGAGEVGEGMAVALGAAGVADLVVANRTRARAARLARRVGGRAIALDEIADALVRADVLLTCTGASSVIIERDDIEAVVEQREGRPLLIIDVAVPRDVDPGVAQIHGVNLLDIDDLRRHADESREQRQHEVAQVRMIIAEELERQRVEHSAREVAPLVSALRERAEAVRVGELDRFRSKLEALDPASRQAVEALTAGIVNKLLHEPTVQVKQAAGTARGELYADALTALFDLPDHARSSETE